MKKYIFPLFLYLIAYGVGLLFYKLLEPYLIHELLGLLMRVVLFVLFFIFTIKFIGKKESLFNFKKIPSKRIYLTLLLLLLFVVNNYLLANYATNTAFMKSSLLGIVILGFVVNSFSEEFAYRGFIQSYVNQNQSVRFPISKGNIMATSVMVVSHFGFFWVMDITFAITGLVLVLIFSLTMGYFRDKGASIWFLIVVHTLANFIHLFFNYHHYIN